MLLSNPGISSWALALERKFVTTRGMENFFDLGEILNELLDLEHVLKKDFESLSNDDGGSEIVA